MPPLDAALARAQDKEADPDYRSLYSFISFIFSCVYTFEFCAKVLGLKWKQYWADNWNKLDAFLMFFQLLSGLSTLAIMLTGSEGSSLNFGFFRALRILKLAKYSKNMQKILMTVTLGAPALISISALLYVLLYVCAILGMVLFGGMTWSGNCGVSQHANFDTVRRGAAS